MLVLLRKLSSLSKLKTPKFTNRSISSLLTKPYKTPSKHLPPIFSSSIYRQFCTEPSSENRSLSLPRDGNYDETISSSHQICPGCGVQMQDSNPKHPGYFIKPSAENHSNYRARGYRWKFLGIESEMSDSVKKGLVSVSENVENVNDNDNVNERDSDGKLNGEPEKPVVCARCHSLRHYGKVKDLTVENLLPDFDFDHTVGRKFASTKGARSVVLMVVDAADFDGSFPRKVAKLVSNTIDENTRAWNEGRPANVPRVVLVVTKIDLLPWSISPTRLEHFVRQRAREGGADKLTSVHLVSAVRGWGLKNLFDDLVSLAGERGNIWAIGAQNAGKSTLINSIGKHVGAKVTHLTEAPVPGTTLGIVRVEGVLPGNAKLFDTPGLLHPHQISTRLLREELKLVQISKEMKPRTYRIKAGNSIHIAGLMRLDIDNSSVETIYITIWASLCLPLHMGKTENACKLLEKHFGHQLQPPMGKKRVEELGKWVKRNYFVSGDRWDSSSVDIAVAGLGWFAVGLKGEASLSVWTYDGIGVVLRNSLLPDRARYFDVPGFSISRIVSTADQSSNKSNGKSLKR